MSGGGIIPGCVLHYKNFRFEDGDKAAKYFVVTGAKPKSNILCFMATSQQHRRKFEPGCTAEDGYYLIPGGGKDFFPKDTWVLLARPLELNVAEVLKLSLVEKQLTHEGNLRTEIANALRNCAKRCKDVSEHHLSLIF